ncbi:MAG: 3-keto-5-aminohexanoate cleavage protein [Anaerolineae bacterium]|nr:3-keto-5-aminohexanoate cleavage protein [Anaerolineae bacterium]
MRGISRSSRQLAWSRYRLSLRSSPTRPTLAARPEQLQGSYELVEWAVRVAEILGRAPATPDEAREIMGLRK